MSISNSRKLNRNRDMSGFISLSSTIDDSFTGFFLLILEEVVNLKQTDKLNPYFGPDQVAGIYNEAITQLLSLPNRENNPTEKSILGSKNDLLSTLGVHIGMIYDLACCYNSKKEVRKEQIIEIIIGAFGGPVALTSIISSSELNSKPKISKDKLINKVNMLLYYIVKEENDFKAIAESSFSNSTCRKVWLKNKSLQIAKLTRKFYLNQSLIIEEQTKAPNTRTERKVKFQKLICAANFLKASFGNTKSVFNQLHHQIEVNNWTKLEKKELLKSLDASQPSIPVDIDLIMDYCEQDKLCLELIMYAKRNREIDRGERLYIYNLGKKIDWDHYQIDRLLS